MLFRPTNNGWSNSIGSFCPCGSPFPSFCLHKIMERFTNCFCEFRLFGRKFKGILNVIADTNNDHTRPQLRHSIIARLK